MPVTSMTTGKVAVPDDELDVTTPTLRTVPKTLCAAPLGVTVACNAFFSSPRSPLDTLASTTHS